MGEPRSKGLCTIHWLVGSRTLLQLMAKWTWEVGFYILYQCWCTF